MQARIKEEKQAPAKSPKCFFYPPNMYLNSFFVLFNFWLTFTCALAFFCHWLSLCIKLALLIDSILLFFFLPPSLLTLVLRLFIPSLRSSASLWLTNKFIDHPNALFSPLPYLNKPRILSCRANPSLPLDAIKKDQLQ